MLLENFHKKIKNLKTIKETPLPTDDFWYRAISGSEPKNLSAVYSCINIKSDSMSKLPFKVRNNNTKMDSDLYNLNYLLNFKPNEKMNASVFKRLLEVWILTYGNAYALPIKKYRSLEIEQILPVHPGCVNIRTNDAGKLFYEITLNSKEKIPVSYRDIIHLKAYVGDDGITGISPLEYARLTTDVGLNQEEFQRSFYENGGRPNGYLSFPTDLSGKKEIHTLPDGTKIEVSKKDVLAKSWNDNYSSAKNAYKTAILDLGVTYNTIPQINPADMDFVNSKTVNIADICRFFNIPQYKLGEGKQSYASNEQASIEYVKTSLVPEVTQWEQEFTLKLLTPTDLSIGLRIQANMEAELRGDTSSRAEWYQKMMQQGVYSPNEVREIEDMPPYEGGDKHYIGPNYLPIGQREVESQ